MNESRRKILRYMGITAASGVAGCVGSGSPSGENGSNDTDGANRTSEEVGRNDTENNMEADTDDDTETDEESVREHHDQVLEEANEIHVQPLADGRYKAYTPFVQNEGGRNLLERGIRTVSYFVVSEPDSPPTFRTSVSNFSEETFEMDVSEFAPYRRLPRGTKEEESGRVDTVYLAPFETDGDLENLAEVRQEGGVWYVDEVRRDWLPKTLVVDGEDWLTIDYALVVGETGDWSTGRYVFDEETDFELVIWDADSPGPERQSRFEGTEVPSLEDMETSWYHEAGSNTEIYLEPSKEVVEPPATVEFTITNRSEDAIPIASPVDLGVWKFVEGELFIVNRGNSMPGVRELLPTRDVGLSLYVFHGEAENLPPPRERGGEVAEFLGGGTYAVNPDGSGGLAALIEVDAPPLEVESREDVVVDRRGSTVVVTRSYVAGLSSPPTFVVERAQDTEGIDERLIPEQVMREPLRNALPFFEDDDVDRVVVQTRTRNVEIALDNGDERRFVYDGDGYVVRRAEEGN